MSLLIYLRTKTLSLCVSLLLVCCCFLPGAMHGQSPASALFAGPVAAPAPLAPERLLLEPSAALPDAPAPEGQPVVRAALPSSAPPVLLSRNFHITPGSSRSGLRAKVAYGLDSTWSLRSFVEAGLITGIPNITTPPVLPARPTSDDPAVGLQYEAALSNYTTQIEAWRRTTETTLRYKSARFEVGFATAETRQLVSNLILPIALHQQARYLPAPVNSDFGERLLHAAASIVVTRNDAGYVVPNYSKLGGTAIAAFVGKSVYADAFKAPELNSGHFALHYIEYSLLGDLATNTAHELVRAAVEPDLTYYELHGRATDDSYYPLSVGGKLVYWLRSTYAPRNLIQAGLTAGLPRYTDYPVEPLRGQPATWGSYADYDTAYQNYGEALLGWKQALENNIRYHERRFYGGLAASESQQVLQNLVIPVLFDVDPRYVPLGSGYSSGERLAHAFKGLVVTHTDKGEKTINLPVLGGTVGAAFAAKELYYPQLGTPALESNAVLARTIGLNLAADAFYNVIGEFFRHRGY